MRWIKYTVIGLAGFFLVCCGLIATAIYLLDDGHYRDALIAVVKQQTGDSLKIEGPFRLDLSLHPRLVASEITLESDTDDYDMAIGKVLVAIDLLPLVTRRLVLSELVVDNLTLNIRAPHDNDDTPWHLQFDKIAVPVIENTLFSNIRVNYWKPDDTSPVNFRLGELTIDDINDAGPVILRGSGDLEGAEFTFTGELGELDTLLKTDQPYPLSIELTTPRGHYSVGGIIGNPDEGSGLDLRFQGKVPELHNVFKLVHVKTPVLGLLEFRGRIRGELAEPALDGLQIKLSHDDVLEFTASGSINNLLTKDGTDIRFEGTSTDAEFIAWVVSDIADANQFVCSGRLDATGGMFWLRDFELEASNPSGLKLGFTGESGLVFDKQPFRHLNAEMTFSAPTSAAVRPLLFDDLPELGAVRGRGRYTSLNDSENLAVEDIDIQFGPKSGLSVLATGRIGQVPLGDDPNTDIALHLDINSPTTTQIADALDMSLPELGDTRVRGLYAGSADKSAFRDMLITAGSPNTVLLEARGQLDFGPMDSDDVIQKVSVKLDASSPATSSLSTVIGHDFPDFGTLEATGNLTGSEKDLDLGKLNVTTRKKDDLLVNIRGDVYNLMQHRQWDLTAEVSARNLKALGEPFHQALPSEGIVKAFGILKGTAEQIQFQGQVDLAKTSMTTRLTGTYGARRPRFEGSITIPEINVGDFGLHPPVPEKSDARKSTEEKGKEFVFSKDKFDLDLLNMLDLDFDITVDEITGTQALIDTVQAKLLLNNGTLSISPANLVFDDGKMQLDAKLVGNALPPRMTLSVKGDDLKIGTMLEQLRDNPVAHGFVTVVVDLETQGSSPADAAANLNGIASFAAENAKVRKTELELLTTDFFGWAVSSALARERYVNVDCAILRTKTVNGIMSIESLMMNTPSIHIKGGGTINLVNQTIDMAIYPKAKAKLWRTANPIKIHGPLADPEVDAISVRAIAQNYGPLIVAPMLFLPAEALGQLVGLINERADKHSPCLKYTEAEDKKAAASN